MRQILAVVRYNFRDFHRNPRVILTFLLSLVLSYLLSDRVIRVSEQYQVPMQAAEPFIWTFGDTTSVLLSSMLLLLLFSDLPKLSPASPYYLVRMTRKRWLAGQFLYVTAVTGIYLLWVLAGTMVLCARYTFLGNQWSETAALLGYSSLGETLPGSGGSEGDGEYAAPRVHDPGGASAVWLQSHPELSDPSGKSSF